MGEPYGPPKMRVFFLLCVIFDGSDNKTETQNAFERLLAAAPAPAAVVAQEEEEPQQQNTQLLSSRQKL